MVCRLRWIERVSVQDLTMLTSRLNKLSYCVYA